MEKTEVAISVFEDGFNCAQVRRCGIPGWQTAGPGNRPRNRIALRIWRRHGDAGNRRAVPSLAGLLVIGAKYGKDAGRTISTKREDVSDGRRLPCVHLRRNTQPTECRELLGCDLTTVERKRHFEESPSTCPTICVECCVKDCGHNCRRSAARLSLRSVPHETLSTPNDPDVSSFHKLRCTTDSCGGSRRAIRNLPNLLPGIQTYLSTETKSGSLTTRSTPSTLTRESLFRPQGECGGYNGAYSVHSTQATTGLERGGFS